MFKNYDKRGSVLLMVVGLLVILGTLGGTFLLVSSLDARQSRLLAGRGRAELIASGGVGKVSRLLGEDLHFAAGEASAPYTASNTEGANKYTFYIDYPSDTVDKHLYVYGADGGTTHYSNVFGTSSTRVSTATLQDDTGAEDDGYLVPTGEFSDDGIQYYIAIKVVDMSSLLSLNTGGYDYIREAPAGTDTSAIVKSPALIGLRKWMDNVSVYNKIHQARCGVGVGYSGTNRDITIYDPECGRKLLGPDPQNYRPFDIADEVYLRWLGSGKKTKFGRVFDQIGGDSIGTDIDKRRILNTASSSRSLVRNSIAGLISARFDLSKRDALNSEGKDTFYTQIVLIAGSDNGVGCDILGTDVVRTEPQVIDNSSVLDNSSASGFYVGHSSWLDILSVPYAVNGNSKYYSGAQYPAGWLFNNLPQATYRVWTSWGGEATAAGTPCIPGSNVPYMVYKGGTITVTDGFFGKTATYSGGDLMGTYDEDQTKLPSDRTFDGQKWQSLGSHRAGNQLATGQLVVEIRGPQSVPQGETRYAFADAVRIEGVNVQMGSGSQPAAHLTANTWAAISDYQPGKAFPFRAKDMEAGKEYTVFGIQEQPFITEAFATHTTKTVTLKDEEGAEQEIDQDSWKWGAAIELMNFSSEDISLANYKLVFGAALSEDTADATLIALPVATIRANGGRVVLYNFGAGVMTGDDKVTEVDVFGPNFTDSKDDWKRVEVLNFDNQTIRLVRSATDNNDTDKGYNIPIDHITTGATENDAESDMIYTQSTAGVQTLMPSVLPKAGESVNETKSSNCRRDDSTTRHRYAVALYWTPKDPEDPTKPMNSKPTQNVAQAGSKPPNPVTAASHKLGVGNGVDLEGTISIPDTTLKEGFRIKLTHGLLSGPGELTDLYLVGPIVYDDPDDTDKAPADLPGLLAKEYATKESRGRANSHVENSEYIKNVALTKWKAYPRTRGATELAWPLLFGEVIETVPMDLERGDSPNRVYGRINVNTASKEVLEQLPWPDPMTAAQMGTAAQAIINDRSGKGGFITPGEVTLSLDGFVQASDPATKSLDRDSIYAAISSCITVNSDMYAVNVRVQLGASKTPAPNQVWYYLAVVDRGCAVFSTDKPAVLLFTPVN